MEVFHDLLIPVEEFSFYSKTQINILAFSYQGKKVFEIHPISMPAIEYMIKIHDISQFSSSQIQQLQQIDGQLYPSQKDCRDTVLNILSLSYSDMQFKQVGNSLSGLSVNKKYHTGEFDPSLSIIGRAGSWRMYLSTYQGVASNFPKTHSNHVTKIEANSRKKIIQQTHQYVSTHLYDFYTSYVNNIEVPNCLNYQTHGSSAPWLFFLYPHLDLTEIFE